MTWLLIGGLAAVTYGSRVVGLLAVPQVTGRLRDLLERLPAPLFAALAALPLLADGAVAPPPVLAAVAGGVLAVLLRRSLLSALLGGLLGYLLATTLG